MNMPANKHREKKESEYHKIATFISHSHYLGFESWATWFLVKHRWNKGIQEQTNSMIETIGDCSVSKRSKERVRNEVLPSLFYVARLHEYLCRLKSEDSQSRSDVIIQWQQIYKSKEKGKKRKKKIDMDANERISPDLFPQTKRQRVHRVGGVSLPERYGTVRMPTESSTPVYHPFQTSLDSHQPEKPELGLIEQNTLDHLYGALEYRTVTHEGTNSMVTTNYQSINNMIMQPNYTIGFNSDRGNCNDSASSWPTLIQNCQL
jgi:hypothetical protein